MICTPLVFCMIYGFSGDMGLTSRSAAEIGSSPLQSFLNITLPIITPSVIAGFIASFAVSFNDVIAAYFISHGTAEMFTLKILSYMRSGIDMGTVCIVMLASTAATAVLCAALCIKPPKKQNL
jgi:ABC-type spermidine/putrescine transport system permease subunit II